MATGAKRLAVLTNYGQGLGARIIEPLAKFIAPDVVVPGAYGQFKKYDDKNTLITVDTSRAKGGGYQRLTFAATDPYYNCSPQGLEIPVDDFEEDEAGQAAAGRHYEAKASSLITVAVRSHADKVVKLAKAGTTATGGVGNWSSSSTKPLTELKGLISDFTTENGGVMPNRLLIGLNAWNYLSEHANVVGRMPGSEVAALTIQKLLSFLNLGNSEASQMQVMISGLGKDTNQVGAGKSAAQMVGLDVFLYYSQDGPSEFDLSFMKTFRTARGGVDQVETYREEAASSDILRVKWSEDVQVTGPYKRITVS